VVKKALACSTITITRFLFFTGQLPGKIQDLFREGR